MEIDIKHIAKLARLRIEDDEMEEVQKKMLSVLEMVENLPEITGKSSGLDRENPMELRKDEVKPSMKRDLILANAPETRSGCLLVDVYKRQGLPRSGEQTSLCLIGNGISDGIPVSYTHLDVYKRQALTRLGKPPSGPFMLQRKPERKIKWIT